jgi:hypothetical protein
MSLIGNNSVIIEKLAELDSTAMYAGIFYSISLFLSITGNVLVLLVLICYRQHKSVTNFFIMNLAVSDLMFALLTIPSTFVTAYWLKYWPYSELFCKLLNLFQTASVTLVVYTLVWLTLDKFWALVKPLKVRMSVTVCRHLIFLTWVFSIFISLPIALTTKMIDAPFNSTSSFASQFRTQCVEEWPDKFAKFIDVYNIALLIIQYFAPLVFLTFCYAMIGFKLMKTKTPGVSMEARDSRISKTKHKVQLNFCVIYQNVLIAKLFFCLNI